MPSSPLETLQGRQRLLTIALRLTHDTALAPTPTELALLQRFVDGELTIEQVEATLAAA
jgi:hypothetical protein